MPLYRGCSVGPKEQKPAFVPVDAKVLASGAPDIAKTLLGFLTKATSNQEAMKETGKALNRTGLAQSALYGPMDDLDQFGHVILFNAGKQGFLRIEVHNDKRYVEPLILRKGCRPVNLERAAVADCKITNICTNTIDLSGGPSTHDFTDQGAEDPVSGFLPGFDWSPRATFIGEEVELFTDILKKASELLEAGGQVDPRSLMQWLNDRERGSGKIRAYAGVKRSEKVTWYDWIILFSNGASAMVQVASGDVQPAHALGTAHIDPRKVTITFDSVPTNVEGEVIQFPHVTQRR